MHVLRQTYVLQTESAQQDILNHLLATRTLLGQIEDFVLHSLTARAPELDLDLCLVEELEELLLALPIEVLIQPNSVTDGDFSKDIDFLPDFDLHAVPPLGLQFRVKVEEELHLLVLVDIDVVAVYHSLLLQLVQLVPNPQLLTRVEQVPQMRRRSLLVLDLVFKCAQSFRIRVAILVEVVEVEALDHFAISLAETEVVEELADLGPIDRFRISVFKDAHQD